MESLVADKVIHTDKNVIEVALDGRGHDGEDLQQLLGVPELLLERGGEGGGREDGVLGHEELVLGDGEGGQGLGLLLNLVRHGEAGVQEVEETVDGGDGDLPLQHLKDQDLPMEEVLLADGVVSVDDELLGGDGDDLAELGGQEDADSG